MDKSRKQFEAWFAPQKEEMKRNGLGMISITRTHQRQLSAWQASRESLEVELPKKCNAYKGENIKIKYYFYGINQGIDKCKQILISNGVKIKNE